jgi:hypothetical protein
MKYALLALGLIGCGSTESTNNAGTDAGSTTDAAIDAPATNTYSVTFGPITVSPGTENTQCITTRLKNAAAVHIGSIHNVLSGGSHHLIVYRVADTEEKLTPYNCQPFSDTLDASKGSPLMITQKKDDSFTLPKGVAFTLDPNQMVRLEMHYINAGSTPKEISATSTLIPIADADFKDEASFLFIGTPDISLPPMTTTTIGPMFFKAPADYADSKFFAITGHEHAYGTNVKVAVTSSAADPGKPVYDIPDFKWDEPRTVQQDPPFTIPAGGGFTFSCSYNNTSSSTVTFGESATKEMCFFWAYYYPSKGARVCFHTKRLGGTPVDTCCPGGSLCDYLK